MIWKFTYQQKPVEYIRTVPNAKCLTIQLNCRDDGRVSAHIETCFSKSIKRRWLSCYQVKISKTKQHVSKF